jgi:hypothetical protein
VFPEYSTGTFVEVAFFHKSSRTLLVTDTVVHVGADPPPVCLADRTPLLYMARDTATDPVRDTNVTHAEQ